MKNTKLTALKLTPFTLLEAIGIVAPNPPMPTIPKEVLDAPNALTIIEYVRGHARAFYSRCPELSRERILAKVAEQRSYCQPEAIPLFETCVESTARSPNSEAAVHDFLSSDYMFRFNQYGRAASKVLASLTPFFFAYDHEMNVSKFRIAKALWDATFTAMKLSGTPYPGILDIAHNAMRIKSQRDLVDCELVHYACYGYKTSEAHYRVVCFTCDSPSAIVPRISVYKGIVEELIQRMEPTLRVDFSKTLTSAAGAMVFCDKSGHFLEIVLTGNVDDRAFQPTIQREYAASAERINPKLLWQS